MVSPVRGEAPYPTWYDIESSIDKEVRAEGLSKLTRTKYEGTNPGLVMRQLNLSVRAGDTTEAARAIKMLAALRVPPPEGTLSDMANYLIGRKNAPLARLFLEAFPQASPGWGYVLIRDWCESDKSKKNRASIDNWLVARIKTGVNSTFWIRERIRFLDYDGGNSSAYITELADDLKKKRGDANAAIAFLDAIESAREKPYVTWLIDYVNLSSAFENYRVGERLGSRYPTAAIRFFEKSLQQKFSQEDQRAIDEFMRKHSALWHSPNTSWEPTLRSWTKQKLAECYKQCREPAKAQKLLLELSKTNQSTMPVFALTQLAGGVQSQLTQHPLEQMIAKAEPENKNSPKYWLGRADYYKGRKDQAQTIAAYERALALTVLPAAPTDGDFYARRDAVSAYAYYLRSINQTAKGVDLFWKEMEVPQSLEYQQRILNSLKDLESSALHSDDKRLWAYLSAQPEWGRDEELLIWKMYENGPLDHESFWNRCEQLAAKGKPSRSSVLGWVMTRCNQNKRAIPLLERACSTLTNQDALSNNHFTLFEAYIATNNWQQAEKLWPKASKRLTSSEVPRFFAQIAVAAAKSGAKQDALRLWKQKDELDRAMIEPLTELAECGLKPELIVYYKNMVRSQPASTIPKEALKLLGH